MVRCASLFKIGGKNKEQMAGPGLKKDDTLGRLSFSNVESTFVSYLFLIVIPTLAWLEKKGVMGCERGTFVLDILHRSCLHYCLLLHQDLLVYIESWQLIWCAGRVWIFLYYFGIEGYQRPAFGVPLKRRQFAGLEAGSRRIFRRR